MFYTDYPGFFYDPSNEGGVTALDVPSFWQNTEFVRPPWDQLNEDSKFLAPVPGTFEKRPRILLPFIWGKTFDTQDDFTRNLIALPKLRMKKSLFRRGDESIYERKAFDKGTLYGTTIVDCLSEDDARSFDGGGLWESSHVGRAFIIVMPTAKEILWFQPQVYTMVEPMDDYEKTGFTEKRDIAILKPSILKWPDFNGESLGEYLYSRAQNIKVSYALLCIEWMAYQVFFGMR